MTVSISSITFNTIVLLVSTIDARKRLSFLYICIGDGCTSGQSPLVSFPLLVVSGCVLVCVSGCVLVCCIEFVFVVDIVVIITGHLILLTMKRYESLYFHS